VAGASSFPQIQHITPSHLKYETLAGCICCTLRSDLLEEVTALAKENKYDYLVIESTGIAEPMPVAETFTFESDDGTSLSDVARLDTMVTVVDSANFMLELQSTDTLTDRDQQATDGDEREISDLVLDQLEFADVILVNKCDLADKAQVDAVEGFARKVNPKAKLIRTSHSVVDLSEILNTGLFDFAKAEEHQGWLQELEGEHIPETEEYQISSFVFKSRSPFHSGRLASLLDGWLPKIMAPQYDSLDAGMMEDGDDGHHHSHDGDHHGHSHGKPDATATTKDEESKTDDIYGLKEGGAHIRSADADSKTDGDDAPKKSLQERFGPPRAEDVAAIKTVLRSKGYVWVDTMPDYNVFWSQAGKHIKVEVGGPWWAAVERSRWPEDAKDDILSDWDPKFGDRETELVVIGHKMDRAKVEAALQWCVLTPDELASGIDAWKKHPDPLMDGVDRAVLAKQLAAWIPDEEDEDEDDE